MGLDVGHLGFGDRRVAAGRRVGAEGRSPVDPRRRRLRPRTAVRVGDERDARHPRHAPADAGLPRREWTRRRVVGRWLRHRGRTTPPSRERDAGLHWTVPAAAPRRGAWARSSARHEVTAASFRRGGEPTLRPSPCIRLPFCRGCPFQHYGRPHRHRRLLRPLLDGRLLAAWPMGYLARRRSVRNAGGDLAFVVRIARAPGRIATPLPRRYSAYPRGASAQLNYPLTSPSGRPPPADPLRADPLRAEPPDRSVRDLGPDGADVARAPLSRVSWSRVTRRRGRGGRRYELRPTRVPDGRPSPPPAAATRFLLKRYSPARAGVPATPGGTRRPCVRTRVSRTPTRSASR